MVCFFSTVSIIICGRYVVKVLGECVHGNEPWENFQGRFYFDFNKVGFRNFQKIIIIILYILRRNSDFTFQIEFRTIFVQIDAILNGFI